MTGCLGLKCASNEQEGTLLPDHPKPKGGRLPVTYVTAKGKEPQRGLGLSVVQQQWVRREGRCCAFYIVSARWLSAVPT